MSAFWSYMPPRKAFNERPLSAAYDADVGIDESGPKLPLGM